VRMYACRLSSEASLWSTQLSSGVGEVWEFLYMAVTSEGTQGGISLVELVASLTSRDRLHICALLCAHTGCYLQTTSRSQLRSMKSGCEMAVEILKV